MAEIRNKSKKSRNKKTNNLSNKRNVRVGLVSQLVPRKSSADVSGD